jgi:acyl-coenzyme A synthetase/AMP-(fatty) acid ligase
VTPKEQPEGLPSILAARPMRVLEIPEISELLDKRQVPVYLYQKTFQEAAGDPFLVLHTSGSTGLPKPIIWKNSLCATIDAYRLLPAAESDGRPPWTSIFTEGDRFYSAFPLFHVSTYMTYFLSGLFPTREKTIRNSCRADDEG